MLEADLIISEYLSLSCFILSFNQRFFYIDDNLVAVILYNNTRGSGTLFLLNIFIRLVYHDLHKNAIFV
jgi:hypothetical protein